MNRSEITYLTNQLMQKQNIPPEIIEPAVQVFINTYSEKISSFEYSEKGIQEIENLVRQWGTTEIGKKFMSDSNKKLSLKDISDKIKNGSIVFKDYS